MTLPSPIDPERLAALLDGRLTDSEAAAVRAQLAESDDEMLSAFADANAIARELDDRTSQERGAEIAPLVRRRRWSLAGAGALAAAALIVAVLVIPRGRNAAEQYRAEEFASALPEGARSDDMPRWSATRGGSALSAKAQAARVGVLLVHVALAESRGTADTAAASEIARVLGDLPGSSPVVLEFQNYAAGARPATPAGVSLLGQNAVSMVDHTIADASAYLESARLASTAGDVGFFAEHRLSALDALRTYAALDASEQAQVTELTAMDPVTAANLSALKSRVEALLDALTR